MMTDAIVGVKTWLGRVGENETQVVRFNVGTILAEYPDAQFTVLNRRPCDAAAYPVNAQYVTREGENVLWTVQSGDLTAQGTGECAIRAEQDGKIKKTVVYMTQVGKALDETANPPQPWQSWVEQVKDDADRAEEAASKIIPIKDTVTDQSIANMPDACEGAVDALVLKLNPIQEGSGDPSPSNVRPITGRDKVKVYRTGKNIMCGVLNHPVAVYSQGDPDTQCIITSSAGTSLIAVCKGGETYTVSGIANRNRGVVGYFESYPDVNSVGDKITVSNTTPDGYRFTATKDGYYACYVMNAVVSTDVAQIEIGTTATTYKPYNGEDYQVTLPSIVYGGEVDWKQGKLKITKGIATWTGDESEHYTMDADAQYGWRRFRRATDDADQTSGRKSVECNMGVFSQTANTVGTCFLNVGYIYYYAPNTITSIDDFKTWLQTNNLQFVYPLATPVEYDLASIPDNIMLSFGENNLWISSGTVKSMTYTCDTKLYIDRKVSELQALILEN